MEFRKDAKNLESIQENGWYPGIVKNITQFGAFVDIGIKENGLVHISQMADHFVENALDTLKVGQEVSVMVLNIDLDRKRIALTCKTGEKAQSFNNQSSGGSPRRKPSKSFEQKPEVPIKNNAFAALKNFKL